MIRNNRLFFRMVGKVLDLLSNHPMPNPPARYEEKLGNLRELNARAKELASSKSEGNTAASREAANKRTARDILYFDHLVPVRQTARALSADIPNFAKSFPLPRIYTPVESMSQIARAIAAEAEKQQDVFIALGHPNSFVQDMRDAIAEYERAEGGKVSGVTNRINARLELEQIVDSIKKILRYLDTMVRRVYKGNVTKVALWKHARTQDDAPVAGDTATVDQAA